MYASQWFFLMLKDLGKVRVTKGSHGKVTFRRMPNTLSQEPIVLRLQVQKCAFLQVETLQHIHYNIHILYEYVLYLFSNAVSTRNYNAHC